MIAASVYHRNIKPFAGMDLDFWLDLLFPSNCLSCDFRLARGACCCDPCRDAVPLFNSFFCGSCLARQPDLERACHRDHPYRLGAAADYNNDTVRELVHALKFRGIHRAAEPLGQLLIRYAEKLPMTWTGKVVVPVPLGKRRERERGYNQAALLAERFAERFGLPLESEALIRSRETAPQSELNGLSERKLNTEGCFAVKDRGGLAGRDVVLIDDVHTTGNTLLAAAKILKTSGARKITALVAARA